MATKKSKSKSAKPAKPATAKPKPKPTAKAKAKPAAKAKGKAKAKPAVKAKATSAVARTKAKPSAKTKPTAKPAPTAKTQLAAARPAPKRDAAPKPATAAKPAAAIPTSRVSSGEDDTSASRANTDYPFLYLEHGKLSLDAIGKASGAYIAFQSDVPPHARAEVMAGCPEPIAGIWAWGPNLVSTESMGDVFDFLIAQTYGDGTEESINEETVDAFAADVERWARGVHAKFPIRFFLGPAQALELSPWGDYSERAIAEVMVPFLEEYAAANAAALAADAESGDGDGAEEDPTGGRFDATAMSCILQHVPRELSGDLERRVKALEKQFPL